MGQQVLVVDDSDSIRLCMKYMIEDAGYDVLDASNGKEALRLIRADTKLVITDINMPEMDGIDLIRSIRHGAIAIKSVPIVTLTTEYQEELKQQGRDAGATASITKPFQPEEIITAIRAIIG